MVETIIYIVIGWIVFSFGYAIGMRVEELNLELRERRLAARRRDDAESRRSRGGFDQ